MPTQRAEMLIQLQVRCCAEVGARSGFHNSLSIFINPRKELCTIDFALRWRLVFVDPSWRRRLALS